MGTLRLLPALWCSDVAPVLGTLHEDEVAFVIHVPLFEGDHFPDAKPSITTEKDGDERSRVDSAFFSTHPEP